MCLSNDQKWFWKDFQHTKGTELKKQTNPPPPKPTKIPQETSKQTNKSHCPKDAWYANISAHLCMCHLQIEASYISIHKRSEETVQVADRQ